MYIKVERMEKAHGKRENGKLSLLPEHNLFKLQTGQAIMNIKLFILIIHTLISTNQTLEQIYQSDKECIQRCIFEITLEVMT